MAQSAVVRLGAVAWALVRADALLPREIDVHLSPAMRIVARSLRIFAG